MSFISSAVQSVASGIGSYFDSRDQAKLIKKQARIQAEKIQREAAATAEQQRAAARAFERQSGMQMMEAGNQKFQADEELRQGEIAQERANLEQLKGEREAAKRSRLLAQEIGEQYAQFAGNGFLVDAAPGDTFGSILSTTTAEGQADISTIQENAKAQQWTFEEERRTQQRNAANSLRGANNSVFAAQSSIESAQDARRAAATTLANASSAAADTLRYAKKAARMTRRAGTRALWSGIFGGGAQAYSSWASGSSKSDGGAAGGWWSW